MFGVDAQADNMHGVLAIPGDRYLDAIEKIHAMRSRSARASARPRVQSWSVSATSVASRAAARAIDL
uniref:hypothetical protein n=1 Tax=Aquitalea magnusonii TaxID=332411 RepID=UPI001EFACB72